MPPHGAKLTGPDIVAAVRAVAAANQSATAIEIGRHAVTYRGLLRAVDGAARMLWRAGVRSGDVVVVRARRSARLPIALLALWELGATVVPVDAALPAARLAACERVVAARWRLGNDGPVRLTGPDAGPVPASASHVLFTSGTSGRPAAVAVDAGALLRALAWYGDKFAPAPGDRLAMLGGLGHDPVLRDILGALTSGATLVVPSEDVLGRPDRLPGFLRGCGVTVLHATPALLELVSTVAGPAAVQLPRLRLVISAGAVLRAATARRLRTVSDALLFNAYGTTETPQIASCAPVDLEELGVLGTPDVDGGAGDLAGDAAILPVGTGAGATQLVLAGRDGRGEVIVRSPNLALGYVAESGPGERFITDPLGAAGYRAYRTGDIGERDHRGWIRIVARADRQLEHNGHRIAPEEIESAALAHPAVLQAAAGAVQTPTGDLLTLSVVPRAGTAVEAAELRAHLRAALPGYAVPARLRIVARLDLTENHKVARERIG